MSEDNFWLGVGAGTLGAGFLLYEALKLQKRSYEKGLNGEELESSNPYGIFGWTKNGARVFVSSFNRGKYDRQVRINLDNLRNQYILVDKQIQFNLDKIQRIEYEVKEKPKIMISADERNFLKELHEMTQNKLAQPQSDSRNRKFYIS